MTTVATVIVLNGLLALGVCFLTVWVWRWRRQLQLLSQWLDVQSRSPQNLGYAIASRRVQLVSSRLGVLQWQQRVRQLAQFMRLLKLLRFILLYRMKRSAPLRR